MTFKVNLIKCLHFRSFSNFDQLILIWRSWHLPAAMTRLTHVAGHLPHGHHHAGGALHAVPVCVGANAGTIMAATLGKDWEWLTARCIQRELSERNKLKIINSGNIFL